MVMRAVAVAVAALAFGSTLAGAATTPNLKSGLRGVVMRGPTKPICRITEPCEEPAVGVVLQFRVGDRLVTSVRTGNEGRYKVRLRRGTYAVTRARRGPGDLTPRTVRVPRGRMSRVDFHIDTGIQ